MLGETWGDNVSVLDAAELEMLKIERMVFHIVGPRDEHFQRLEEINPGGFANFFLDRIRSASRGNSYRFSDVSGTRERLLRILINPRLFQPESEALAEDFQAAHGGQTAPGAFLLFLLTCGPRRVFALMKYDDDTVLTYELEEASAGRKRAKLADLSRNFVKSPDALQKAALVTLDPEPGFLTVLDHRNQNKIARYFENFLGARREFKDADLTKRIYNAAVDTILENPELVPPEVFREVRRRAHAATVAGGRVEAERNKVFLESIMGAPLNDDDQLVTKFKSKLRQNRIEAESFDLDSKAVPKPRQRRIETLNGVRVQFSEDLQDLVHVDEEKGEIIITDKIRRNDVEPDPRPRAAR